MTRAEEEADSKVEFSGDKSMEENHAENKRNLPFFKDKETETSEAFLTEEQQTTSDLKLMVAEEIAKRQKVEKKVLDLEAMIESDENTQIEIKVLKNLCQEEAQLRRDLQADVVNKKLRIERLKMKIKMLDAEKEDVLGNVHMMRACLNMSISKKNRLTTWKQLLWRRLKKEMKWRKKLRNWKFCWRPNKGKLKVRYQKTFLKREL